MGTRVPDLRGLFLRGHGGQSHNQNNGSTIGFSSTLHQSGGLGQIQGDAIRPITGRFYARTDGVYSWSGAFTKMPPNSTQSPGVTISQGVGDFDSSRVTPTASEIRPVNIAVRYLIKAMR